MKIKNFFQVYKFFLVTSVLLTLPYAYSNRFDSHESIFTDIYHNAIWGRNDEGQGFSGGGSLLHNTLPYIKFIQEFLASHNIKTIVDAGCGDWEFSKYIDWKNTEYTGYDVVAHVIKKNMDRYSSETIKFHHANLLTTTLPPADLLICKHVLQHLPNADVVEFLKQSSNFKYCLITNEVDPRNLSGDNSDISIGGGHKLDLRKAPFNIDCFPVFHYSINNTIHQVVLIDNTHRN